MAKASRVTTEINGVKVDAETGARLSYGDKVEKPNLAVYTSSDGSATKAATIGARKLELFARGAGMDEEVAAAAERAADRLRTAAEALRIAQAAFNAAVAEANNEVEAAIEAAAIATEAWATQEASQLHWWLQAKADGEGEY